jgi:acyl-[acyl-carrier-protein]-phospholipid O-acyltransferase/long-chain-fatty-acid--[acyl-carrier-protein] ligase
MVLSAVALFVRIFCRLLFGVTVKGELRKQDKLLIVANHASFLDGILLGAFLGIKPTYLVHSTIAYRWHFRIGLQFLPHLVVDSTSPLAMKAIIGLLEAGTPVVIFPEGRITVTGSLMKIYDGPAFVAARSGANVVPVHIEGAVHSYASRMSGDFPKKLFPRITITINPPSRITMPEAKTAKLRRRLASEQLRRLMQQSAFNARKQSGIFEAFLDSMALYGKHRQILEDIRQKPESYAHLLKASLALGRIVSRHAGEGEMVGVLMANVSTTVSLLLGMFAMRRTPAVLNYTAGAEGMQSACESAKVKVIFTSRAFIEKAKLGSAVAALRGVQILYLEDQRATFTLADKLWLMLWAVRFPRSVMKAVRSGDPAVVLFTSGSEGKPKGVVLSHGSILANVAQAAAVIEFSSKDKFMSALPLFHSFGLTVGIVLPLLHGCRVFLYPSPLHYRVIPEMIYDRDCTVMFATNTFLANYAKQAHPYDFYRLKHLVVGAEKLSEEVRKLCMDKLGIRPLEGYGATECSPVITFNTPMANRPGSVGEFMPGIEHQLEPVPGLADGGTLHVKGPNVMLGYLKHDQPGVVQPPKSIFGEGWYNTGDIVAVDEDGFVKIQGRMRRFAKIAGEMVSLEVVENIAAAAQPGYQHASAALKDSHRGEMIVLFTEDPNLQREQLQAAARELGAPELALPRRIFSLDKIPVLGNGKKDYVTLDKMAAEKSQSTAGKG